MKMFIFGALLMNILLACAGGSKRPDFDQFPKRSDDQSIWQKCTVEQHKKVINKCPNIYDCVCRVVCEKYTRKNVCKKGAEKILSREVKVALDAGDVIISKALLLEKLKK